MNTYQSRMSPLTAMFLGIFGVSAVGIASGTGIVLLGMNIIDKKAGQVIELVEGAYEGLPAFLESLPPGLAEITKDHRAPEYAAKVVTSVDFIHDSKRNGLRPVLTITNTGSEVISMMTVRVAAINKDDVPICDWTEVVATPLAIDESWPGVLMPNSKRRFVLSGWARIAEELAETITGEVEISELRIWTPDDSATKTSLTNG